MAGYPAKSVSVATLDNSARSSFPFVPKLAYKNDRLEILPQISLRPIEKKDYRDVSKVVLPLLYPELGKGEKISL